MVAINKTTSQFMDENGKWYNEYPCGFIGKLSELKKIIKAKNITGYQIISNYGDENQQIITEG